MTQLESPLFLLLNFLIALAFVVGLLLGSESWIKARSTVAAAVSPGNFKRWALIVVLLFLFVHANGAEHWTGLPFQYDSPVRTRVWAGVLDVVLGILLVVVPLRYAGSQRRGYMMAFATFYFLANLEDWQSLKQFLGIGGGRGFPFNYTSWYPPDYDLGYLMINIIIGLLFTLLVYRISSVGGSFRLRQR